MGSVYNRGTRSKPNWYVAYKDSRGKRKAVASHQPTKALARRFLEQIEARIAAGEVGLVRRRQEPPCEVLLEEWMSSLRNRRARCDRQSARRHLLPVFGEHCLRDIDLPMVMRWLDAQRATGLAEGTMARNLGLLSRFFSWAVSRGLATTNPVRQIPTGKRPRTTPKKDSPWLQDEQLVRRILDCLSEPIRYMFYLGNRSGMRPGEIVSLRLSDFDCLDQGVIRVRYSHDGPLKEDRRGVGKVKWVPAADDCAAYLAPWMEKRRAETDDSESHVFPSVQDPSRCFNTSTLNAAWRKLRARLGVQLKWYQATRHSFASRLSAAGVPIDEIADALGHSSPVITRQYYDHYIRKSYPGRLRGGLGFGATTSDKPTANRPPERNQLQLIGVLGDIHAEDRRLAAALAYLRGASVDRILSVGDIVDGPGDVSSACAQFAADDIDAVRGNHERWLLTDAMRDLPDATPAAALGASERQFLESLPVVREYATTAGRLLLCHGLGVHDMASVQPDDDGVHNVALQALIAGDCYRIVVGGHSHRRMVRRFGGLTLINAGTLSRGHRSGFARIDLAAGAVTFFDLLERGDSIVVETADRNPLWG